MSLALSATILRRLPLTTGLLYLGLGVLLGREALGAITLDPIQDSGLLERLTEGVVIISLFAAGLKLRISVRDRRWMQGLRLATISMACTIALVAAVGVLGLGMPIGAAILLGAILAPTDPVLASDVQVENPGDTDLLRFGLTGEAGLNDGAAFPFVMLGLGLLGHHELGELGWRWLAVDLVWAVAAGLAIGAILGTLVGKLILHLRREHKESIGTDDFLALGLIGLSYGIALYAAAYGFLAVFAAGLALRRVERLGSAEEAEAGEEEGGAAVDASGIDPEEYLDEGPQEEEAAGQHTPAFMARAVLGFSEQLERIGTVGVVLIIGAMITRETAAPEVIWFAPLLFFVIRPLSVLLGLAGSGSDRLRLALVGWFGVRGIGSIYYLTYAVEHGLSESTARQLSGIVLTTVAASVIIHGISVTPLMKFYSGRVEGGDLRQG